MGVCVALRIQESLQQRVGKSLSFMQIDLTSFPSVQNCSGSGSGSGSLVGRAPELRHHTDGVHNYGAT